MTATQAQRRMQSSINATGKTNIWSNAQIPDTRNGFDKRTVFLVSGSRMDPFTLLSLRFMWALLGQAYHRQPLYIMFGIENTQGCLVYFWLNMIEHFSVGSGREEIKMNIGKREGGDVDGDVDNKEIGKH